MPAQAWVTLVVGGLPTIGVLMGWQPLVAEAWLVIDGVPDTGQLLLVPKAPCAQLGRHHGVGMRPGAGGDSRVAAIEMARS